MSDERTNLVPIPAQVWAVAAITGTGALMAMLDSTVINLATRSIGNDFDSPLTVVQWTITGYLIALAAALPATGWLSDNFGAGLVWQCATVAFVATSLFAALAPSVQILIVARALQGVAAGIMIPSGQAIAAMVASREQLGRVMGVIGSVIALGPALGPAFGGALMDLLSWRSALWINVPIGLIALIFARRNLPRGSTKPSKPLDAVGLAMLGGGLALFLVGAISIPDSTNPISATAATLCGAIIVAIFIRRAATQHHPLVNVHLFRNRPFTAATIATGIAGANMYGGLLLIPLLLHGQRDMNTTEIGLMLLVLGLGSAAALPIAGAMTDRYGARYITIAGALLTTISTIGLWFAASAPLIALTISLAARGAGLALIQAPPTTAAYTAIDRQSTNDAATLINIVQRTSGAIGAASIAGILAATSGVTAALAALTIVSIATAPVAIYLRSNPDT